MGFIDEKIIKDMNEYKKDQYGNIYDGVYIREELLEFEKVELFDGKISIMIPKTFIDMPEKLAKLKYPSSYRPEVIKMNETTDVNIMFTYSDVDLDKSTVEEFTSQVLSCTKKVQPSYVFFEKKTINENDKVIGWFDFKCNTLDEKLYNLLSYYSIEGKMLQVGFSCKYADARNWKPIALQIIDSLEDNLKNKER